MASWKDIRNRIDALFNNSLLDPFFIATQDMKDRVMLCLMEECEPYFNRTDCDFEIGVNNGSIAIEVVKKPEDRDIKTITLSKDSIISNKSWDLFD